VEEGNNKGVVLLVTTQKEGAVTGGPAFIKAVGDNILEGVVSENLPGKLKIQNNSIPLPWFFKNWNQARQSSLALSSLH